MDSKKTKKEKQENLGPISGMADCKSCEVRGDDVDALDSGDIVPLPTKSEIYNMVDDMMRNHFIGRRYFRRNIWDIDMCWSLPIVWETIAAHPKKWLPLHKMVNRLEIGCRFDFWRIVFENRNHVPQNELLRVWYDCLNDRGCQSFQRVATEDGYEDFGNGVVDFERQKRSVITEPLLIDDPVVSFRYCQVQKPGWQKLQYIHGRRHQTLKLPDVVREAIHEDNIPIFAMHLDMSRRNIPFSMLMEVLNYGAVGIFRYLMKNKMVAENVITPDELCCFLTAWFQDDISVPMLSVLEELQPGLVKGVTDVFGRNLLWFAVQNMKTGWFHPNCKLTPFLLEHGCDPRNVNQVGLPWQMVKDGLPQELKIQMMRRRYNMERVKIPRPYSLELNQPLAKLTKSA